MHLLTGFYNDADAARTEEFLECVRRNCANGHIDQVILFLEDQGSIPETRSRFPALAHSKVELVPRGGRQTFSKLFDYANQRLGGTGVIIANADIFFDETLGLLESEPLAGRMLCLSRWDERPNGAPQHFDRPDSQDVWIFEPPIPRIQADFSLGIPGCDNRVAFEAERVGLVLSNPSRSVRARHLHHSAIRRYTERERLDGPARFVAPSFLKPSNGLHTHAVNGFSSHRGFRFRSLVEARSREVENAVGPLLGGIIPRNLKVELRRAVAVRTEGLPHPAQVPFARVAFREPMGYTIAELQLEVSTHNNHHRPLVFIPDALAGMPFTQVVSNYSTPVEVQFQTNGRLLVLAAPGWEGYAPAAAFLDEAGWREPLEPLRTRDGTIFQPWSLVANAGEHLTLPTQVMLVAAELNRF